MAGTATAVTLLIFNLVTILSMASPSDQISNNARRIPIGAKVHVIAPSGKGTEADLPRISSYIEANNLVPFIRPDIYSSAEPIYANTDEYRAMDLIDALTDDSQVIWAIRGGAGAARLTPFLDAQLPPVLPSNKLLIGFSDITVLHTYLIKRYNWTTAIHGGMLAQIVSSSIDSDSISTLWDIIFNRTQTIEFEMECMNSYCRNSSGSLNSKVTGGNLVLVEKSIGTTWETESTDKLLLLEDTGEAPYRTERSLDHLKQAGIVGPSTSGVLLGDFIGSGNESLNEFILQRFADSLDNLGIPVFRIPGVGHARRNLPVPLNTNAVVRFVGGGSGRAVLTVDFPNI